MGLMSAKSPSKSCRARIRRTKMSPASPSREPPLSGMAVPDMRGGHSLHTVSHVVASGAPNQSQGQAVGMGVGVGVKPEPGEGGEGYVWKKQRIPKRTYEEAMELLEATGRMAAEAAGGGGATHAHTLPMPMPARQVRERRIRRALIDGSKWSRGGKKRGRTVWDQVEALYVAMEALCVSAVLLLLLLLVPVLVHLCPFH
jgi:hypothetical protein